MKTKAIIEWLRGYADGLSVLGNYERADMIRMAATHLEELEADRDHLLEIAEKMHLWIFKNTFDEYEAYKECGLTDEDDARLGYGGRFEIEVKNETSN